jgi:hypothetical protein
MALNVYPPGRVPLELLGEPSVPPGLEELIAHIQNHHRMNGRSVSREKVLKHLDNHSRSMGMDVASGRGFFGDLWGSIKSTASNLASNAFNKFKEDPMGTIESIATTLGPLFATAAV